MWGCVDLLQEMEAQYKAQSQPGAAAAVHEDVDFDELMDVGFLGNAPPHSALDSAPVADRSRGCRPGFSFLVLPLN